MCLLSIMLNFVKNDNEDDPEKYSLTEDEKEVVKSGEGEYKPYDFDQDDTSDEDNFYHDDDK